MQDELRKLAKLVREQPPQMDRTTKRVKCAQVVQAALGLSLLGRKIGR
jgi:hypothetical protein